MRDRSEFFARLFLNFIFTYVAIGDEMSNVRDILHLHDVHVVSRLKPASQKIGHEEARIVSDVRTSVDRRSAGVHRHTPARRSFSGGGLPGWIERNEVLFLLRKRVVEAQGHAEIIANRRGKTKV